MINQHGVCDGEAIFAEGKEKRPRKDFRSPFGRDADRILHSIAYTRYLDKTQVFSFEPNDFITRRVIHVSLLCRIARYIGRKMGLNNNLVEALAWGHDIGHTPFGHIGEDYLSEITEKEARYKFSHNVQSVRWLQRLERRITSDRKYKNGLNLSIQTLDGILNHNGENFELDRVTPSFEYSFDRLHQQIKARQTYGNNDPRGDSLPATLEGCVVRFSDVISYITRDIEDALILGVIKRFPETKLGSSHGEIITQLMDDLIENSEFERYKEERYLRYSDKTKEELQLLYDKNYRNIYDSDRNTHFDDFVQEMFHDIYKAVYKEINQVFEAKDKIKQRFKENSSTAINYGYLFKIDYPKEVRQLRVFRDHIKFVNPGLDNAYNTEVSENQKKILKTRIAADYISGMTDRYFIGSYCHYKDIDYENLPCYPRLKKIHKILFFRKTAGL